MGAAIWGKKARVKSGRRKAPCPLKTGGMHTTFSSFIINSTKKVKGVWSVNAPIFILYPPKNGEKKATANDTKGRCGNEFRMTL